MATSLFPFLVSAVIAREAGKGVVPLTNVSRETAIRLCLEDDSYALWYLSGAAAKFSLDVRLALDATHATGVVEYHAFEGLPDLAVSRRGLELCAACLSELGAREKRGGPPPGGGSPMMIDFPQVTAPHKNDGRNPDPGGPASAWPVEYKIAA